MQHRSWCIQTLRSDHELHHHLVHAELQASIAPAGRYHQVVIAKVKIDQDTSLYEGVRHAPKKTSQSK